MFVLPNTSFALSPNAPNSSKLSFCLISFSLLESSFLSSEDLPLNKFDNVFTPDTANAAPAAPPRAPGVEAFSNPKNLLSNFSAGTINPNATITYRIFFAANSIAEPISTVYKIKCIGCNNKLNKYSFSQVLKA